MLDHVSTVSDSFAGRMRRLPGLATLTAAAALGTFASPAAGATCESLAQLAIPNVTIASAQTVAAGAFTPPPGRGGQPAPHRTVQGRTRLLPRAGRLQAGR